MGAIILIEHTARMVIECYGHRLHSRGFGHAPHVVDKMAMAAMHAVEEAYRGYLWLDNLLCQTFVVIVAGWISSKKLLTVNFHFLLFFLLFFSHFIG